MANIVNLETLGTRKGVRSVVKPVPDQNGIKRNMQTQEEFTYVSSLLTLEEALQLGEQDWQLADKLHKGKVTCKVNSRRFFLEPDVYKKYKEAMKEAAKPKKEAKESA